MIRNYVALATVGLVALAGQVAAAETAVAQLSAVKGSVMVSQGAAFAKAGAAASLKAGDRVVASGDSSAQLHYADGCVVNLAAQSVVTVGAKSPCAPTGLVSSGQPMQEFLEGETGKYLGYILMGAIVIGGGAAVANDSTNSGTQGGRVPSP